MSRLLEARGLVKHLGGRRVVDGVDLTCEAGQILGLLGPNGAGKTTTLRMLYGFLRPDVKRETLTLTLDKEVGPMIEMTLEMAEKAVKAAQAKAKALGTPMTITVVDEAGRLVLSARGDGTGFLTPDTSRAKAMASVAFRRPTKEMVDLARESPAFWNAIPGLAPGQILPSTGAVPIKVGGRVIGAIGCGGGTGEEDHQCALAGAAALGSA